MSARRDFNFRSKHVFASKKSVDESHDCTPTALPKHIRESCLYTVRQDYITEQTDVISPLALNITFHSLEDHNMQTAEPQVLKLVLQMGCNCLRNFTLN